MLSHMASRSAPTGAERSLGLLARGLRERGHEIGIVVPGAWCLAPELHDAGIEIVEIPCRVAWLTYFDPQPWPRAAAKWLRFVWPDPGGPRIQRWLARWKPDVVHVNCLPHVRGASRAAHETIGAPVVWHLREILPPGARRGWFARKLESYAARIVAVSDAVGRWVREEELGGRLTVVPNGVEIPAGHGEPLAARRALGLPRDGYLVGMFGQLVPHKGGLEFVRAARAALARQPDLRFILAGPGPASYAARLRDAVGSGPDSERIHLLPAQPSAEPLYRAADALCLPTLTPDPFPRSILEAMAHGLPVVAFRGGGVEELVRDGDNGLLVDAGDSEALATALAMLAADTDSGRTMGSAGRRRAEAEFSLSLHFDRMEQLLHDVARRR
jgi:glycosyltransferase involved in cell wall biosynthesis